MDNCVRENKNKYVLGFLAYLVETGVFSEVKCIGILLVTYVIYYCGRSTYTGCFFKIELGFLMVGHTHEDIDQSLAVFPDIYGKMML